MKRRQFIQGAATALSACAIPSVSSSMGMSPKPVKKRLYVDGLSFVPEDHNDIKAAGMDAYIADISAIEEVKRSDGSVNYKRTYNACIKSIQERRRQLEAHPETFLVADSGKDITKAVADNQCAVFLQIQGADCVEGGLHQVDDFHDLGLRVLQLTHHYDNLYAGGALSLTNAGLSPAGLELIDKLESKNMLIDLSHSSVESAVQTLARAKGPVVQTHGAARAIVDNARCTPDSVIKSIADSGGAFGVFMMSWWLTNDTVPRPEHFINHLQHIKNIAGIDAVAIANDYPIRGHLEALASGNNNEVAIGDYRPWWESVGKTGVLGFDKPANHIVVPELNHVKRMRSIEYLLMDAKFTSREIDKVMGENWQRVLEDVLV